tara:strand:- start:12895 stop:13479 length:585 start_codon:yes stop_codon:yes gene_type:complete
MDTKQVKLSDSNFSKNSKKKKLFILIPLIFIFGLLTVFSWVYFDVEKPIQENNEVAENKLVLKSDFSNEPIKKQNDDLVNNSSLNEIQDSVSLNNDSSSIKSTINAHKPFDKLKNNIFNIRELEYDFLVVIGTFRNIDNALNFRDIKSESLDANCKVVNNNNNLFWVVLDFFDSVKEGKQALKRHNIEGWVKKL